MTAPEALAMAKKHHFWIVSIIVVLVAVLSWQMANSAVSAVYAQRKSAIEGKYKLLVDISGKANHPNESFAKGVQVEHDKLKVMTLEAWNKLYNRQKEKLIWPDVISPRFTRIVPKLGLDEEIPADLREQYMNFIRDEIPKLYEVIDVRRLETIRREPRRGQPKANERAPAAMGIGNQGGMNREEKEWFGKVAWDEKHRDNLESHYEWRKTPTTKQVRYAQEDIWIYRALLHIIANTNGDQKEHLFMPIKSIKALDVGRDASVAINASMKGASSSTTTAMPPAPGAAGPAGADPKAGDKALDDMRFVNDKCVPIPGGEKLPYAEFKMIPVRFLLVMNQMKVSDLLVHCANSPLPVEIRRWRINPSGEGGVIRTEQGSAGATPGAATAGTSATPRSANTSSRPTAGSGGMVGLGSNSRRSGEETEISPDDVDLEVIGMIYLFNPPDIGKLGTGGEGQPGTSGAAPTTVPPPVQAEPAQPAVPPSDGASPPGELPADKPVAEQPSGPEKGGADDESVSEPEAPPEETAEEPATEDAPAEEAMDAEATDEASSTPEEDAAEG